MHFFFSFLMHRPRGLTSLMFHLSAVNLEWRSEACMYGARGYPGDTRKKTKSVSVDILHEPSPVPYPEADEGLFRQS